jgi:DNA-binding LacI/PurR family transcriptional regulator
VRRGLAAVTLLDYSTDPRIPTVRIDDEGDAYLATAHLAKLGHRRIAYLNDRTAEELAQGRPGHAFDRYRGYRRALDDAGIPFDPACIFAGHWSPAGGRAMVRELLAHSRPRPTALFCFNDLIAIGALRGLYEAGVQVPSEMAVLGFDGIEPGAFTTPALSTVGHSREDLGRLGVETLLGLLDGRAPEKPDHVLPGRLIIRESCGSPSAFRVAGEAAMSE